MQYFHFKSEKYNELAQNKIPPVLFINCLWAHYLTYINTYKGDGGVSLCQITEL